MGDDAEEVCAFCLDVMFWNGSGGQSQPNTDKQPIRCPDCQNFTHTACFERMLASATASTPPKCPHCSKAIRGYSVNATGTMYEFDWEAYDIPERDLPDDSDDSDYDPKRKASGA